VCALVQDAHGVVEKLPPRLFYLIPTVVGTIIMVVASILQHAFFLFARSALFDHIINNTNGRIAGRTKSDYNIEYRKNDLEEKNEIYKIYHDNNKDKIFCGCGS
jgi:hypothetical protein